MKHKHGLSAEAEAHSAMRVETHSLCLRVCVCVLQSSRQCVTPQNNVCWQGKSEERMRDLKLLNCPMEQVEIELSSLGACNRQSDLPD